MYSLYNAGVECYEDIQWNKIKNKRTQSENQQKLDNLILGVDVLKVRSLRDNVCKLKEEMDVDMESVLDVINNEDNSEFDNEIKQRKQRNLAYIYNKYLQKKRGRSE